MMGFDVVTEEWRWMWEEKMKMKGRKERNVPSVIVSATKNNANGGMPSRAFSVANTAERIT